jgi:uncharacterized Tic20 family protein
MSSSYPSPDPGSSWNPSGGGQLVPSEDRNWALASHIGGILAAYVALGFIAPLIVLLLRGNQSPFVRRHAVESLNFHIFVAVLSVVAFVLVFVGIGIVLLALLGLYYLIGVIMGTVAASQGREFRYPVTVRLIR